MEVQRGNVTPPPPHVIARILSGIAKESSLSVGYWYCVNNGKLS